MRLHLSLSGFSFQPPLLVMSFSIRFKKLFNILTFLLTVTGLPLNLLFLYKSNRSLLLLALGDPALAGGLN